MVGFKESFTEFLDSHPNYFKEDLGYFVCPWMKRPEGSAPVCMRAEVKRHESGELEFKDKDYGNDTIVTLDLKSLTIEDYNYGNPKKYTIDESESGYRAGANFVSFRTPDFLDIHTVPENDPTVTEPYKVSLYLISEDSLEGLGLEEIIEVRDLANLLGLGLLKVDLLG